MTDAFAAPDLLRVLETSFAPAVKDVGQTGTTLEECHREYQKAFEAHLKSLRILAESGHGELEQANQFCKELTDIVTVFEKLQTHQEKWFQHFIYLLKAIVRFGYTEKDRVKKMTHSYFKEEKIVAKNSKKNHNPAHLALYHTDRYQTAQKQYCQRYAYFAKNYLELLRKLKESFKVQIEDAENQLLISDSAEALKNLEEVVNINDTLKSKLSIAAIVNAAHVDQPIIYNNNHDQVTRQSSNYSRSQITGVTNSEVVETQVVGNGVERVVGEETEVKHVPLTTQNSDRGRDTHILHVNHNINGVQDTKPYSNGVQGSQQETSRRDSHHNVNIRYVGPIHVDTTEKAEDTKYQPTAGFVGNDPIIVDRNDAYHSEIIADEAEEVTPIITQDIRPVVVDVEDHDRTGRNEYIVHTTTTYTQSEKQTSKNPSAPSTPHSVRRTDNVQTASVQTEAQAVPIVPVERVAVKPVDVASHSPPRQRYSCRSYEEETRPQPRHEYEYLAGAKRPKVLPPGIYKPTPITGLLPKDNYDNKQNDRYEKFENRYQNASYHPQYVRPNNVYDTDRPFSRHSRQNSEVLGYHTRNHSVDSVNFNQPIPLAGMHSLRQPPPKYIKPSDAPRPLFSTSNYGRWLEVVTSYEAQGEHQLSLNSGDRIKLIKSGTRGWVLGRTIKGRQGWYPAKFLRLH